jgi:hypothetical protein
MFLGNALVDDLPQKTIFFLIGLYPIMMRNM